VAGADRARRMDIAMMIWVLKGADGRVAIVDSGFHREQYFRQFTVKDYISPSDAIVPLGLKPSDVTDIFLSHMHWDHAGGIDLFPSARVWLQKEEYDYYTGDAWQSARTVSNLRAQDRMRSLATDPRLVVPGHDPAVFDRFPKVSGRIVRIE
jgi:glyoxylase-like metal-dependent hydrolase (beta-lactamase superfamily II)